MDPNGSQWIPLDPKWIQWIGEGSQWIKILILILHGSTWLKWISMDIYEDASGFLWILWIPMDPNDFLWRRIQKLFKLLLLKPLPNLNKIFRSDGYQWILMDPSGS